MEWAIDVLLVVGAAVIGLLVGLRLRLEAVIRQIARGAERHLTQDEQEIFIQLMDKVLGIDEE